MSVACATPPEAAPREGVHGHMAEPKPGGIVNHPWLVLLGFVGTCAVVTAVYFRPPYCLGQSPPARTKADICVIHEGLDSHAADNGGRYPDSLEALVTPDELGHGYLNLTRIPRDPWGREYIYVRDSVNVMTLGADGKPGGTGDDADIDYKTIVNGR
jgi:general secretion pathway protein G